MHVKTTLIAVTTVTAALYLAGRYGHEIRWPGSRTAAVQQALAQGTPEAEPFALPEVAQAPGASRPATPPAGAPVPGQQPQPLVVDESALRYFASQGDTRRLEAEMARLRALYPEWKPPTDLMSPRAAGDPELERMWRLFGEGKIGEVRAAIAQRSGKEPNWQAPPELIAQLDMAEAAQRLVNASNARQWEQVIRLGTETPSLLTCANVDALWRVAEAFLQTGKPERARDAYSYVLTNCTNPAERVGTMQKALATLSDPLVAGLLAQERQNEFSSIRDEIARRQIGRAATDPKVTVSTEDLNRIEALANAATTPDDPILLGFYYLHHNDAAKAVTWFQTALARKGGAKAAEGAVLALGATQKYQEAEALGAQWLSADAANRKAYLDVATALISPEPPPRLDRAVLERIAKTVASERYAPGGTGLGWYAYNSGQMTPAETWFETARSWDRNYEPAAYGLALVRQRLRDLAGVRALIAEWGNRSERIADILNPARRRDTRDQDRLQQGRLQQDRSVPRERRDIVERRDGTEGRDAAERLRAPEPAESVAPRRAAGDELPPVTETPRRARRDYSPRDYAEDEPLPARRPTGLRSTPSGACGSGGSGAAALQRGWCLLSLKRPAAAAGAFEAAMQSGSEQVASDAAAGLAYAKIQQGLTAEAGVAAANTRLPPARRKELSALLLAERFYAQYDAKDFNSALVTLSERARYAPESLDLMMMRGWSYFNLGRYDDASRIFTAVYRANGSAQAQSGLAAIRDVTQRNRY